MPLKEGSSREVVGQNVKTEIEHGKPQQQAVAIALKEAGLSNQDTPPAAVSQPPAQVSGPDSAPTGGYSGGFDGMAGLKDYGADTASPMGTLPQIMTHAQMIELGSQFNYNQKR